MEINSPNLIDQYLDDNLLDNLNNNLLNLDQDFINKYIEKLTSLVLDVATS